MTTTRLAIPDVSCAHCKQAIEGALAPLAGVERVEVDVTGKVVAVEHDAHVAPVASIAQAIEQQGYTVAGHDDLPGAAA